MPGVPGDPGNFNGGIRLSQQSKTYKSNAPDLVRSH